MNFDSLLTWGPPSARQSEAVGLVLEQPEAGKLFVHARARGKLDAMADGAPILEGVELDGRSFGRRRLTLAANLGSVLKFRLETIG